MVRAKSFSNARYFSPEPHVRRPQTQFTCQTCNFLTKRCELTSVTRKASHAEITTLQEKNRQRCKKLRK